MFPMPLARFFSAALCGFLCAAPAVAEDHWIEVRSPHFRVLTDSTAADARMVAAEFELMRYVVRWRFPAMRPDSNVPLTIVAARDGTTMKELAPTHFGRVPVADLPTGEYFTYWERDLDIIRLSIWKQPVHEEIYRGYIHALLEANAHGLPQWMDTGFSTFLASTRFEDKRILIGAPTQSVDTLRHEKLFSVSKMLVIGDPDRLKDNEEISTFFAEAWAMIHYMTFAPGMQNGKLLDNFYRRIEGGQDQLEAFTATFGDPAAVDIAFQVYVKSGLKTAAYIPAPPSFDPASFSERTLSPAQALYEQALIHNDTHDPDGARTLLKRATALDSSLGAPFEELAFLDYRDGKDADARSGWQTAYHLDPTLFRSLFALTLSGPSLHDQTSQQRLDTAEALRKVIQINPRFAPAYSQLAILSWWQGDLASAYAWANKAVTLEPWRPGYEVLESRLLLAQGKGKEATQVARQAAAYSDRGDREEAIAVWLQVPAADRQQGIPLAFDLPSGTMVTEGMIVGEDCGPHNWRHVQLTPLPGFAGPQPPATAAPAAGAFIAYSDTVWIGGGPASTCHRMVGHRAFIGFKPGARASANLLWLGVQDDLPPPSRSAALPQTTATR